MRVKLVVLLLILTTSTFAQELKLINEFELPYEPLTISIDRYGKLYFANDKGEVDRYSAKGELEYNNSTNRRFPITLIEAWQGLKTFVYSSSYQEYFLLDRFFNNSEFYRIERDDLQSFNGLATIENDQTLWTFNTENQTLRKIDLFNYEVIFDNQLNLILDIDAIDPEHMRVYQNLVFISEKDHGIAIFDNLGNYLDFIAKQGVTYFSFLKDEIILYDGKNLELIDIYKKNKRAIPLGDRSFDFILMEKDEMIGIKGRSVQRFKLIN